MKLNAHATCSYGSVKLELGETLAVCWLIIKFDKKRMLTVKVKDMVILACR